MNMNNPGISCPLCTQPSFDSLDSLKIHLVSVATRPLTCPVCNETLLGIDKLTIHLFGHTINSQYEIGINNIIDKLPNQMTVSPNLQVINHDVQKNVSNTKYETFQALNHSNCPPVVDNSLPIVPKDDINLENENLEMNLNVKKDVAITCELKITGKNIECDICKSQFSDKNILILHQQLIHRLNKKTSDNSEVVIKNYSCHLCTKVFKMRGSLIIHMRVAHLANNIGNDSNGAGFNCPTCGKNFRKEQHVTQHLKTHDGKQWECEICSKMFTTKYFLKKHKRLHSGEMPYKCTLCNKSFTFQQSYHKHRLYHKDDKPHTCITCGRSFKELSTLHNHERIHTGEKPFACETCGKCFRQRVSYLVHRRIHTGVMPYSCNLCGKSFRYKVSQRTHKCPIQMPPCPETTSTISLNDNLHITIPNDSLVLNDESRKNSENLFPSLTSSLSPPIAEFRQIKLSCPVGSDNLSQSVQDLTAHINLQKDIKYAIDGILLQEKITESSVFQTINEDSLRELLSAVDK